MLRFGLPFAVLLAVLLAMVTVQPAAALGSHARARSAPRYIHLVLGLVNGERAGDGLSPLHLTRRLSRIAVAHSLDMADRRYFAHDAPSGATPYDRMREAGITYHIAGENLGWDRGSNDAAMLDAINTAMMNSPEHRANLLRTDFSRIGIGVVRFGSSIYLTEDFTG